MPLALPAAVSGLRIAAALTAIADELGPQPIDGERIRLLVKLAQVEVLELTGSDARRVPSEMSPGQSTADVIPFRRFI